MLLLVLAFAVFAWGLHYKLSLYRSGATCSREAAAKLLSQKERPLAGFEAGRLLLHGLSGPLVSRRVFASTVAARPANERPEPGEYAASLEPEANSAAERLRHLDSSDPRGPPSTI